MNWIIVEMVYARATAYKWRYSSPKFYYLLCSSFAYAYDLFMFCYTYYL